MRQPTVAHRWKRVGYENGIIVERCQRCEVECTSKAAERGVPHKTNRRVYRLAGQDSTAWSLQRISCPPTPPSQEVASA